MRQEWLGPSYFTYLPKGIYGAWLLNFVSARTNRRHHHHLHQWGLSFAQDPSSAKHAHSAHGRAAAKVRVATKTPLRSGTCPPAGTCRIARVMKAPTRPWAKKRAAEELLGRVHLPRLYAVWQAAGAARRPAHLPLWTTGLRREARLLLSRLAVPAARASGSGAYPCLPVSQQLLFKLQKLTRFCVREKG